MKVTITITITLTLPTATVLTAATVKEEETPIAINKQQPTATITTPPEEATETLRRPTHHHYSPSKHTTAPTRLVQCTKSLVMSRKQKCTLSFAKINFQKTPKLPKNQSINYNA
jgi:hypothetical protein